MFTEHQSSVSGKHFSTDAAWNHPFPVQPGGPRIMIGGAGEKVTFRLAAQYADELNIIAPIAELPRKLAALHEHLDDLGRPRDAVRTSTLVTLVLGDDDADVDEQLVAFVSNQGVEDAAEAVKDPDRRAELQRRLIAGTEESAGEQLRQLVAVGVDGVVVNLPTRGHDPAYTERAVRLVRQALDG